MLRLLEGGTMGAGEGSVKLEVLSENLVITPTLASLLVRLARWQLHHEALRAVERSSQQEHAA
jgi:hypothetical protein